MVELARSHKSAQLPELQQSRNFAPRLEMPAALDTDWHESVSRMIWIQVPFFVVAGMAVGLAQSVLGAQYLLFSFAGFVLAKTRATHLATLGLIGVLSLVVHPIILAVLIPPLAVGVFLQAVASSYLKYATGAPFDWREARRLRALHMRRGIVSWCVNGICIWRMTDFTTVKQALAVWLTPVWEDAPGALRPDIRDVNDRVSIVAATVLCWGGMFASTVFVVPAEWLATWCIHGVATYSLLGEVSSNTLDYLAFGISTTMLSLVAILSFALASLTLASPTMNAASGALKSSSGKSAEQFYKSVTDRLKLDARTDSHFVGVRPISNAPVVVPMEVFSELSWFYGPMGSGKTTALMQLADRAVGAGWSVIYLDLKGGSNEIVESLRTTAQLMGIPLRIVTTTGAATHGLNPFQTVLWSGLSQEERVEFALSMVGASHDRSAFGQGFFSTGSELNVAMCLQRHPDIASPRELADKLLRTYASKSVPYPRDLIRAGSHVVGAMRRLRSEELLNVTSRTHSPEVMSSCIDFTAPFKRQEMHYFQLPMARSSTIAGELARMACNAYPMGAEQIPSRRRRKTLFIVDEFHTLDSKKGDSLKAFLTQTRSLDIGVAVTNQTPGQLLNPSIAANVINGTRYRQCFGLGPDDLLRYEATSGKRIETLSTQGISHDGVSITTSRSFREELYPAMDINELKRVTADPSLSMVEVVRGTQDYVTNGMPHVVKSVYHISKQEYERRKAAEWPDLPGMIKRPKFDPTKRPERPW